MKTLMKKRGVFSLILCTILALLFACEQNKSSETFISSNEQSHAGLILKNAYIPYRSDQQQHFAAYFELKNNANTPVRVTDAHSPAFGTVMLHETVFEDGMAKMKHIEAIQLAPGERSNFKPKGKHVMLMQPLRDLATMNGIYLIIELDDGQKLKYDIEFQKSSKVNE